LGSEAHVEHPVSFIEHQNFTGREIHTAALKMIDESPWRCHNNSRIRPQGLKLSTHRDSTDEKSGTEPSDVLR
jgi:hypothetical protein